MSSTVFGHIASDELLQPLGHFATPEALKIYPPTKAGKTNPTICCGLDLRAITGQQVNEELTLINLANSQSPRNEQR